MAFSKRPAPIEAGSGLSAAENPAEAARELMLRELTRGPRSAVQLERLLIKHDCPTELIDELIERYKDVGLVDDKAYAKALVNTRRNLKKLAKPMIKRELVAAGLAEEDFTEVLENISRDSELELATELALKKLRASQNLPYEAQVRRTSAFLARRGFGSSLIGEAIRNARQQVN